MHSFTSKAFGTALAASVLGLAVASGARAQSIGINFTGSNSTAYALGYGTKAGIVPNKDFNDVDGNFGTVNSGSLFDSAGQATGATLTYAATTVGASQSDASLGPNYILTKGFIDIRNPATDSISLSNIGYTNYDAYVFVDGAVAGTATYTVNTTNAQIVMTGMAFNGTFQQATTSMPGDYILFSGLSGDFSLKGVSTTSAPVDGLEIVNAGPGTAPVPEVGTAVSFGVLLLLGAAGLGLSARRRRGEGPA